MTYTPDPTDFTNPTLATLAGTAQVEFQAIKLYIQNFLKTSTQGGRNLLLNPSFNIVNGMTTYFDAPTIVNQSSGYGLEYYCGTNQVPYLPSQYSIFDQWVYTIGEATWGAPIGSAYAQPATGNSLTYTTSSTLTLTTASGTEVVGVWQYGGSGISPNISGAYFGHNTGVGTSILSQSIESAACQQLLAGTILTLSGNISNSDTVNISIVPSLAVASIQDNFGVLTTISTGAAISGLHQGVLTPFDQQLVLSADCTNGLALNIVASNAGTKGYTLGFNNLQLEVNGFPTPFEAKNPAVDLIECKRFFQSMRFAQYIPAGATNSYIYKYPFNFRTIPSVYSLANVTPAGDTTFSLFAQDIMTVTLTNASGASVFSTADIYLSCRF